MDRHEMTSEARLRAALAAPTSSARLQAALAAGTRPNAEYIDTLIERCATEPDFFVRDMLTWALTRHDASATVDRLLVELRSPIPQARSQALHTLSKMGPAESSAGRIGGRSIWPAITTDLLHDPDDEVARAAWRAATGLVPDGGEPALAEALSSQFGRGDREVRRSLSRAFAALGHAASPAVERAKSHGDPDVRTHAAATERLMADPDEGFDAAVEEARRVVALGPAGTARTESPADEDAPRC